MYKQVITNNSMN